MVDSQIDQNLITSHVEHDDWLVLLMKKKGSSFQKIELFEATVCEID
jgi:hypothetical protein